MSFILALAGRPNVGKSTLFNRLTGTRHALVHDEPGVTRDWREGTANLGGVEFTLLDTAGYEKAAPESFSGRIQQQTRQAVARAHAVLLMVDGRSGLLPDDRMFAEWLRSQGKPVIIGVNKCETNRAREQSFEAWELGLGEPIALSAAHGDGMSELLSAIMEQMEQAQDSSGGVPVDSAVARQLQVAIVGRPNAGKSTLMNSLLGEDRVLTGPEAGITRDAIAVPWEFEGQPLVLVDTAGMRKRGAVDDHLEQLAVQDALRVIRYAQVVILMVDAHAPLEKQDATIARQVAEEGRGLVIAVNKWDSVEDKVGVMEELRYKVQHTLPQVRGVPIIPLSALHQHGIDALMRAVFKTYELWNMRYSTSQMNRFLQDIVEAHTPPLVNGRRIKLQYMTQVKARPPSFVIFGSKLDVLPDSYEKYLTSGLRDAFNLPGVPIRILFRNKRNPYDRAKS